MLAHERYLVRDGGTLIFQERIGNLDARYLGGTASC